MTEDNPNPGRFADSSITRREFARLSAAAGAALALPGNATADASSEAFTAEYQYVLNHTPDDHAVPTLVRFSDSSGPSAMEAAVDGEVITTTEPEPAAYSQLTTSQAQTVADLPSASEFQFSPGSNPFWRIGYYPLGVFPEPRRAVDYIGFEQMKDGLRELEERYPDRIRVKNVGRSPGHYNYATDREDPKGMYVAELTNFDSETSFEEKEKVFYSLSLHGPEVAGRETGARVLENVARSSEPDIEGSNAKIEPLLDDVVVIMGFVNPDGWVARNPQYGSSWQADIPKIPFAPLYERGNAEVYDSNRQYPVVGQIKPDHYPAHPSDGVGDPPSFVHEKVPDAAAFVEFFGEYENLNYGADLHGGPIFNEFVLGLISQDQFDTRQLHELYEMCLNIDETLEEALEVWTTAGDVRTTLLGDDRYDPLLYGILPTEAFDYSTIYDTINYTVSGAFLDWLAHPEPIGLDLTTLDFEMSFSWAINGQYYNPELVEMEVKGYRTAIRTITAFAVRNSDTPTTGDQFEAYTETGGESVAYVTTGAVGTDEDALRSTDDELEFSDQFDEDSGTLPITEQVTLSADTTELTFEIEEHDLHSMGFQVRTGTAVADVEVVAPDGTTVGEFQAITEERAGGRDYSLPEFSFPEPEPGEWTVRVDNKLDTEQEAEFQRWTFQTNGPNPDPNSAWPNDEGFVQREYNATPFRFFEDYGDFVESGSMEPVTVEEVADGALVDGDFDHAVVIHDYGANGDADYIGDTSGYSEADHPTPGYDVDGYVGALDEFVDGGGNLVLTDAGVNLLTELDNELVNGDNISRDDIDVSEFIVARFEDNSGLLEDGEPKNLDHPLFGTEGDVRPIQNQLWKVQPLGYYPGSSDGSGEAPMYLPDEDALADAGGDSPTTVAGRAENTASDRDGSGIAAASITPDDKTGTGVHVISSLLPPQTQQNLHPFGLQDYTVTFLGYVMFTSALGWEQVRETGDDIRRYGIGDEWDTEGVEHISPPEEPDPEFSASGSREDDGHAFTAGQSNHVRVTVETTEFPDIVDENQTVDIVDSTPWEVYEGFLDADEGSYNPDDDTVTLATVEVADLPSEDEDGVTWEYLAEAPQETGEYTFGEAKVVLNNAEDVGNNQDTFGGSDTNYVVGTDQSNVQTATNDD